MGTWHFRMVAIVGILGLALGLATGCLQASTSNSAQEFYKGKTVTWIVSSQAGADTDLLARAIAPVLSKELGATVKVENRDSAEGINWVYTDAKRDGLTMVMKSTVAVISDDVLKAPGVLYEADKYNYVADVNPARTIVQGSPKNPYRTVEDMRKAKGLRGGGTTAKGALAIGAAVTAEILGLDAKIITGFNGKKNLTLALARGEADYLVSADGMAKKDEDDGFIVNLFTLNKERSDVVPSAPSMFEAGVTVPKELEAVYQFATGSGTSAALPPEVPQERIDYMRDVFNRLSGSEDLRKEYEKLTPVWTPFISGKDLQARMASIKANKDLVAQLDKIFSKYKATQ